MVFRDSNVTVTAFRVRHGKWEVALGYTFVTKDRVIVVSGDTRPSETLIALCNGCDVLVHEVYVDSTARRRQQAWRDYDAAYHTSSLELADVAMRARPKLLLLYHQFYRGASDDDLLREVRSRYTGRVIPARDLGVYESNHGPKSGRLTHANFPSRDLCFGGAGIHSQCANHSRHSASQGIPRLQLLRS